MQHARTREKGGQFLKSQKEVKVMEIKQNMKGKPNEQVLGEIKLKVLNVVEQMSEEPKFMEVGFNLTNYEAFVKEFWS